MKFSHLSISAFIVLTCLGGSSYGANFLTPSDNSGPIFLLAQNDSHDGLLRSKVEEKHDDDARDRANQMSATKTTIDEASGMTQCPGEFALCLASTCRPTGKKIKVKRDDGKSFRYFEESECKCPVITAEIAQQNGTSLTAIAGVNEGNMNGSCAHRQPNTVWALYNESIVMYPQESASPPFTSAMANMHLCQEGTVGSNCWNFECKVDKETTNGAKTATCYCAINDGQFGREVRPNDSLFTAAGGYYNPPAKACGMYPANGWLPPVNK